MHGLTLENDNLNFENFRSEEKFRFNFGSEMNDRPQQSYHYTKYARLGDIRTEKIIAERTESSPVIGQSPPILYDHWLLLFPTRF